MVRRSSAMGYILVLTCMFATPALGDGEAVRGAMLHAAFAAGCPLNDDAVSLELAQRMLDAAGYDAATAQDVFDDAIENAEPESEMGAAMMCGLVEQIERDHPFK